MCVCKVIAGHGQGRVDILRVGNDMPFVGHVRKFVPATKKHRLCLGRECTIYPCNSCKNKLL